MYTIRGFGPRMAAEVVVVLVVVVVVAVVVCRSGLAQMPLHRIAPAASLPERAAADEPARNG